MAWTSWNSWSVDISSIEGEKKETEKKEKKEEGKVDQSWAQSDSLGSDFNYAEGNHHGPYSNHDCDLSY